MIYPWRVAALAFAAGLSIPVIAAEAEWMSAVGSALGKTGSAMPGGVYRVGLARTDLKVTLDGVEIKPALALGSWLAFTKKGKEGMVMGDLVLLATEVNPVMKKLVAHPLTDKGLAAFLADWAKTGQSILAG